jgi:hypothetical protein
MEYVPSSLQGNYGEEEEGESPDQRERSAVTEEEYDEDENGEEDISAAYREGEEHETIRGLASDSFTQERLLMQADDRALNTFSEIYDMVFSNFKSRLVGEYSLIREFYMNEYVEN